MKQSFAKHATTGPRQIARVLAGAAIVTAGLHAPAALANHIDFFDQGPFSISATPGSGPVSATQANPPAAASTLGARRDVTLSSTGGTASASLGPTLGAGENDDALVFSVGPQAQGSLLVQIGRGGPLNANFVDIPNSTFDWDRVRVDFGPDSSASPSVQITLASDGVGTVSLAKPFGGGDANLDFLLTEFTAANGAFNSSVLRDIDLAGLQVTGAPGGRYALESFDRNGAVAPPSAQVPVPGVAGLLAIGALGLLRRRTPVRGGRHAD